MAYIFTNTIMLRFKLDLGQSFCRKKTIQTSMVNGRMNYLQVFKWTLAYTVQAATTLTIGILLIELIGRIP